MTILFTIHWIPSFGQSSVHGNFSVDYLKGCAPLEVIATNTSGIDPEDFPIVWSVDWNGDLETIEIDPEQSAQEAKAIYEEPGVYKILQVIGTNPVQIDTITIEVLEPLPPSYKVYNCIEKNIYMDVSQEDYYDQLWVDFGDGESTIVDTNVSGVVHTYDNPGEYLIQVEGLFDNVQVNCGQRDTTITTLDQSELEVASIQQVEVLDQNRIEIHYSLPNPHMVYQLELAENGDPGYGFATYELESNSSSFIIEGLSDTRQNYYCFRIASVNWCNEVLNLYSDAICSIALQAAAENVENQLTWETNTTDFSTYQVLRDGNLLDNISQTSYRDVDVQCQQVYEYQITAEKAGIVSISELIALEAVSTNILPAIEEFNLSSEGLGFVLGWEAIPEAQQYYIYREGNGLPLQKIDSLEKETVYVDQPLEAGETYCYQISYVDACGNESQPSMQLCDVVPSQGTVVFPNAFTPNEDGLNDIFMYKANLIERIELQIFNRWGELIFFTDQLDVGWDGMYRGTLMPQGAYLYQATIVDQLGNQFQQQGSFILLR